MSRDWPAPAKINRFLHITGRRADGYHTLQTLFQFIEPLDWLDFTVTGDGAIVRDGGLAGLAPSADLAVRAATALQRRACVTAGVRIHIRKGIPAGGGLGGGSSDAATTLVALNALWGCGLAPAALEQLGLELGADVPVFVRGQAVWAEGIGEQLTPMDADRPWLVVLDPGVNVNTGSVFNDPKLTRHTERITIPRFNALDSRNDCERVVRRLHPRIATAIDALSEFGPTRLTGTGGCIFAWFDDRPSADRAKAGIDAHGRAWVTRAANRSPLPGRLEARQSSTNGA
ncbi:4-(cytidine 5'-diphospho)-2-C-methyl-D-erythritol kinase [Spiribacter vilamensis]|uniref:4-(cytidine 5'-diphospho)-2-C-methyl-D-erythritol kinase n=1 Tax=Spiribacter vilamensis TaxID=531306 RepID=UPI003B84AAE7